MKKRNLIIFLATMFTMALLVLMPAFIGYVKTSGTGDFEVNLFTTLILVMPLVLVYLLNFYLLVAKVLFRGHRLTFFFINIAIIVLFNRGLLFVDYSRYIPKFVWGGYYTYIVVSILSNVLAVITAMGLRYIMRWNDIQKKLEEEQTKRREAELAMLKSQLNPHFLFNTLNNISSMVAIDPDKAQDSIAQLSDLLRYTLYESSDAQVLLANEIEFMQNYIDLMKLRCNELASISVIMPESKGNFMIAPLLFVSLIENAFKHGVNSRRSSFVNIMMQIGEDEITFTVENSLFSKQISDHSGSGIGLDNLRRRLELAYYGRYKYTVNIEEEKYSAKVVIKI